MTWQDALCYSNHYYELGAVLPIRVGRVVWYLLVAGSLLVGVVIKGLAFWVGLLTYEVAARTILAELQSDPSYHSDSDVSSWNWPSEGDM